MIYLENKESIFDELNEYFKVLSNENKLHKKFNQIEKSLNKTSKQIEENVNAKSKQTKKDVHDKKLKQFKTNVHTKSWQDEAEKLENCLRLISIEGVQWQIQILNDDGVPHGPHRFIYASNNIIGANHFSSFLLKHDLFIDEKTGKSILPNDTLNIKIEVRYIFFIKKY